jgi:hypothetical protein
LPASLSQLVRRVRVLQAEERVLPEVKVAVADNLDVVVAEDADAVDEEDVLLAE